MHFPGLFRLLAPVLVAASTGLPAPLAAAAQTSRAFEVGTRVRVLLEQSPLRLVGTIAELRPDTILLARPDAEVSRWSLAVSEISELEVSGGRRRLTGLGVAVGAGTGLIFSAVYNSIVQSQCFSDCPQRFPVLVGAAIGGLVFGGSFYFIRPERWVRIALPR